MRALVTGAGGFIGSNLCARLLNAGHNVIGLDNFSQLIYPAEVKMSKIEKLLEHENFFFLQKDLADIHEYEYVLNRCEVVVNCAGMPSQNMSWVAFDNYLHSNVLATERLLSAISRRSNIYVIHVSSSSVLGNVIDQDDQSVREDPLSPYGVSKLAAEKIFWNYKSRNRLRGCILRLYSVYGPYQRPDMAFARFCKSIIESKEVVIHGDGSQLRTFTFIDDVCDAILSAIDSQPDGAVIDICSSERRTLSEAVDFLEEIYGQKIRRVTNDNLVGDQKVSIGNSSLGGKLLGFMSKTCLRDGLEKQFRVELEALDSAKANDSANRNIWSL